MTPKPYRLVIFAARYVTKRERIRPAPHVTIELQHFGYDGWNPIQHYNEARLPGAGSFLYPGLHAVRKAAMDALALPGVHQVSIRTNQDRRVYLFNKHADGRITGYRPDAL